MMMNKVRAGLILSTVAVCAAFATATVASAALGGTPEPLLPPALPDDGTTEDSPPALGPDGTPIGADVDEITVYIVTPDGESIPFQAPVDRSIVSTADGRQIELVEVTSTPEMNEASAGEDAP